MQSKNITQAIAVKNLQATKHEITLDQATVMVRRFKRFKKQITNLVRKQPDINAEPPKFPDSLAYNAPAFFQLMKSPGCIGIRCYPAIDPQNQFRLVFVGIDEQGNNISPGTHSQNSLITKAAAASGSTVILDEGQASPPFPPPGNDL